MVDVGDVVGGYELERRLDTINGVIVDEDEDFHVFAVNQGKAALKLPSEYFQAEFDPIPQFKNEAIITEDLSRFDCFPDYVDSGVSEQGPYIVTGMDPGILLLKFYNNEHDKPNFIKNAVTVLRNVAVALQTMHKEGKLHCDLKTENCFYDDGTYDARIFDFGVSCNGIEDEFDILVRPNKIGHYPIIIRAPETLISGEHTVYTDVFSFGILAYEVLADIHPLFGKYDDEIYIDKSPDQEIKAMKSFYIKHKLNGIPKEIIGVVEDCLAENHDRIDSNKLVNRWNGLLEIL